MPAWHIQGIPPKIPLPLTHTLLPLVCINFPDTTSSVSLSCVEKLPAKYCTVLSGPSTAAMMNDTVNQTYCNVYDADQRKVMSFTRGGAGILCLILTVIVLVLFVYIQAWKNFRRRILLLLTAST